MMDVKTFETAAEFSAAAVDFIRAVIQSNSSARIALSGGSTPEPVYRALAQTELPEGVEFFQVDERCISPDDPQSNQFMIRSALPHITLHAFNPKLPISEALETYERRDLFDLEPNPFDLCILGIGPDGHTASLFPNDPALKEKKRAVAHTETQTFKVADRLTLTFPPLLASKKILVLLKGRDKSDVIRELQEGEKSDSEFPAKRLLKSHTLTIFYLPS